MNYGCDFLAINSQRDSPFCKYEIYKRNKIIFSEECRRICGFMVKTKEKDIIFIKIKKPWKYYINLKPVRFNNF